ncbi:hypothetical protein NLN78_03215 [Citrobacter portucalensis]|uniref:gp53-like domain-containing protein n=1 Tax=Citrobacter portucalensis TaxID=1639133 RepID=UPI00226A228D|nr:hypothetical protein [Citrobacter portucalensis]MCX8972569.1 hypothetical protein [Citrobacter portucalensis]
MTSFIKVPFASSGDKAAVPDTDAGGGVNMTQGYGQAYSLDPATDPSAKRIERDKMNWLFNRITQAINEIQSGGVAPFITSADNGGSAFSYGKGVLVSLGGVVYQSLVASNTSTPPSANWAALPEKIQPLDATLTALAGLVGAANKLPYFNGTDTATLTDLTSVGRDIIGKTDIAAVLQYLGLTGALIGDECNIAGFDSSNVNAPYMRFSRTNTVVPLATKDYAQPKDQTLTDLSGKDKAELRTYLDLKSAAQRDVGAGANQIPDMNGFTSSLTSPGWQKLPSGMIIQWGTANPSSTGEVSITFPVAFSAYPMYMGFGPQQVSLPNVVQSPVISAPTITNLGCGVRNLMIPTAGGAPVASMSSFFWIAVGK